MMAVPLAGPPPYIRARRTLSLAARRHDTKTSRPTLPPDRQPFPRGTMVRRPLLQLYTVLQGLAALLIAVPAGAQPAAGPYPRPVGKHTVAVERSIMVPMRDGVRLATDI